ncbi:LysR family transcriptional regulator [Paracoccus sp. SCSIO 75233]|uniref:LysR family transcriptional regulator n=1 Tax=Paracoccus sp. SCSIO 75233 TaxID=3017782 RepID=UPI0022F078FF|nr:LysR family transcriptional regulator [Paracoccus sp. SCSIO 75233]WBU53742.1 LysR family transcriptional regulator [Paracoccus sp. SCSIO 75233]
MAINVTHLRSFYYVAEARSFTRAAQEARVSQPTLTRQVSALEADYGVPLLDRTTSRVDLTQEGHQLLDLCRPVFSRLDEIETFLKRQHTRSIRLDVVLCEVVSEILTLAYETFPDLTFNVRTLPSTNVMENLLDRAADFGLLTLPADVPPEIEHFLVYRARLVALVAKSHPWSRRRSISFRELDGQRIILGHTAGASRQLIDRNFTLHDVRPQVVQVIDSSELMIDLAERGVGIAVTGATGIIEKRLGLSLEFEEESTSIDVHFACRAERLRTQPFKAFFTFAKRHIALDETSSREQAPNHAKTSPRIRAISADGIRLKTE